MLPRPDRRHHRSPTMLMRFPLLPMVLAYCSSLEGLHATIYVLLIRDFPATLLQISGKHSQPAFRSAHRHYPDRVLSTFAGLMPPFEGNVARSEHESIVELPRQLMASLLYKVSWTSALRSF